MPSDHDANEDGTNQVEQFQSKIGDQTLVWFGSFNTTIQGWIRTKKYAILNAATCPSGRGKEGRRGSWSKRSVFGCNRVQRFSAWLSPASADGTMSRSMVLLDGDLGQTK
jgi:hypothetical protein